MIIKAPRLLPHITSTYFPRYIINCVLQKLMKFLPMENKSILIIEDHDAIRLLLGKVLSKKYHVITKKDGFEGLVWLSNGNIPDLILLDLMMPRLNGLEFLLNLKCSGFYRDIPVVVLSGDESTDVMDKCNDLGIIDYVIKPFNPIKLNEKISKLLNTTSA